MNYSSPYDLLQLSPDIIPDRQYLLNAKKVMLARLELSNQTTISINNTNYTKHDLEVVFEKLLTETHWAFHQKIERNAPLKIFLQKGIWILPLQLLPPTTDEDFYVFIKDWYSSSYQYFIIQAIKGNEYDKLEKFFLQIHPISKEKFVEVQFQFLLAVRKIVIEMEALLEETILKKAQLKNLSDYYHPNRITCLNLLPDEFQEARNEYGIGLVKIFIALINKYKAYGQARDWIMKARLLIVTSKARAEIQRCIDFYNSNIAVHTNTKSEYGLKIVKAIAISLVVLLVLWTALHFIKKSSLSDTTATINAEVVLVPSATNPDSSVLEVVPVKDPLSSLLDGVRSDYVVENGFVESPDMSQLIQGSYVDLVLFYSSDGKGFRYQYNEREGLEKFAGDPTRFFESAFPYRYIGEGEEGMHAISITNNSEADFLAFLFTEEGYFSVKHIAKESSYTLRTNEQKVVILIAGGGNMSMLDKCKISELHKDKSLPVFTDDGSSRAKLLSIFNLISYKDKKDTPLPGAAEHLEYSYTLGDEDGNLTEVRAKVKLNKKYRMKK
jgi:hypothetical protein